MAWLDDSGVTDLTADIKALTDATYVNSVAYDSTNKKITKTIGSTSTDVVTAYDIEAANYGVCDTAAATAAKTVSLTGFALTTGATIHVKFTNNNEASNPTLNVNSTGAKAIVQYGSTAAGTYDATTGWRAGAVVSLTYDGTSWVRDQAYNSHREIKANDTTVLGNGETALNLIAGDNVTLGLLGNGGVKINATDTNTHRPIQLNSTEILGNTTTALNLVSGSHISMSNSSGAVTIGLESSYITTQSFTPSSATTVNGGSYATSNITCSKTGYTPLGIVGITKTGTQYTTCVIMAYSISSGTASIVWRNTATTNASITPTVTVLFVKN